MQAIREVMTTNPTICSATTSIADAARAMRDQDIGDVLVEIDGTLCGIITDRDIVVRAIAENRDPAEACLGDICSNDLDTLRPDDSVDDAVTLMRAKALRRVPVCDDGKAVGIVSLGDLAVQRDEKSALADISAAPPNK